MSDTPVPSRDHISIIKAASAAASEVAGLVAQSIGPAGTLCLFEDESLGMADGAEILQKLKPSHPAARAMQSLGQAQAQRMGDGVKTAVILAASLIEAGTNRIQQGAPPYELAAGIKDAAEAVIEQIQADVRNVDGPDDPVLEDLALSAARGDATIADLVIELTRMMGSDRITDDELFRISEHIQLHWQSEDRVIEGLFVEGTRASRRMPRVVEDSEMLLVDDDLDMQDFPGQMLQTQTGFERYWELHDSFVDNLRRVHQMGINAILVSGQIADAARERLTEDGVFAVAGISHEDLWRIADFTGATPVPRRGIGKSPGELRMLVSRHDRIEIEPSLKGFHLEIGSGEATGTCLIGGATPAAAYRRWRLATRCAAAVQAAIRGGVCPGGGTAELEALSRIDTLDGQETTEHEGLECLAEALREPAIAIAGNAGHAAEAVIEAVRTASGREPKVINCRPGSDQKDGEIYDAAPVKIAAIRAAVQIAETLLQTGRLYE